MPADPPPGADALYEHAPCGLLVAAADGTLLRVNETLCRWTGYEAAQLLAGMRLPELLTMGGRIFYQTHLQPLLRIQSSVAEVKLELRRRDGRSVPVMLNLAERADGGRGLLLHAAVFVAEDRHKYERELLLQRQRAQQLAEQHARDQQELDAARTQAEDRAQFAEQLVGMVSHDIRNPLSVIHMSTVLLEKGVPPPQQQAAVGRIARAVARVQHLIADLLDFTQARLGGGLMLRKEEADLHQVVGDAVAELAVAFPDCTLRHQRSGAGGCVLDPHRIVQAVGNLVANARTHGAREHPIMIATACSEGRALISVHNRGEPIPAELLPRLFEPMVRGRAAAAQGVGLGLYIVRAIAAAHEGRVAAESSREGGTKFTLDLPRA